MKRFCPSCGKTIKVGTFCSACSSDDAFFKRISVKLCPSNRYFLKGKWNKFRDLRDVSLKILSSIAPNKDVELVEGFEQLPELLLKTGIKLDVDFKIEFENNVYLVPVDVEVTLSPFVAKVGSTYFEGVLQVRNCNKEVEDYLNNFFKKNFEKGYIVNKVKGSSDSKDYFFANKNKINPVANKLIRNFGGFIDISPTLFSRNKQTSKDIYRLTVLVVLPSFDKNDVVEFEDKLLWIKSLDKTIISVNLLTQKKFTFQLSSNNKDSFVKLKKHKSQIVTLHPTLTVINPLNFQSAKAVNVFDKELSIGKNVKVVVHNKVVYVL